MTEPVIDVRGITKAFGGLVASDDITLDLRPGEIHALIGPNGAGKSTLIAQIAGALRPDRGQVWLNGQDVTALDTPARARRGLGRTFQISSLAMD
jgi:branched-chain amino acid transport system ATP-binding protein